MNANEKLRELRKLMEQKGLDAYIIPSSDPHISEYVADHWKARSWITGFTGSAGVFAATREKSGLWTDGRYFIQAEKQLEGSEIELFRMGNPGVPTYIEWIGNALKKGECVGFPGAMVSLSSFREMEAKLLKKGISLNGSYDLPGEMWKARPAIPAAAVFSHDITYAGLSAKEKLEKVRNEMQKADADYYIISSLDDIAWLFNIRGDDVPYVSVSICYALVSRTEAFLFIDGRKVPGCVRQTLEDNQVEVLEYDRVEEKLAALEPEKSIAFDPKRTNSRLFGVIPSGCRKIEVEEITAVLKAIKNETEIANFEECQISDGVAMVKLLMWLEDAVEKQEVTEITVAEQLEYFRRQQANNLGPSFTTIAGYRDHGAMMHYSATEESRYVLENKGMMVLDSGGQYLNGTTDITRTVVFENVKEEEIHDFTMVLKSHIALASARFLYGATGSNLDILARKPLWDIGLDYKCGTGHGVGYCLSVHEGPQGFSQVPSKVKLEKGMVVTIEPGIYREGKHGVRTENMYRVVEDEKTEYGQFMRFEVMTYCPVERRGINPELLNESEKRWLNEYHEWVYSKLSSRLDEEERAWLRSKTAPIE